MKISFRFSMKVQRAEKPTPPQAHEPHPEGNNFTQAERSYQDGDTEIRVGVDRQSIADDDGAVYKVARRAGF